MYFHNRHIRNASFKKQNLSNADFSGWNLKGASFQGANLEGTDFSGVKTGKSDRFELQLLSLTFSVIAGILLGFGSWNGSYVGFGCGGSRLDPNAWMLNPFVGILAFATVGAVSKRWIAKIFATTFCLSGAISLLAMGLAIQSSSGVFFILWIFLIPCLAIAGIYAGYRNGSVAIGCIWIAFAVSSAISAAYSAIRLNEVPSAIFFAIFTLITASLATHAFHRHFVRVSQASHTSFRNANLRSAKFYDAILEDCDFSGANLEGVEWDRTTIKNCKFSPKWKSVEIANQDGWRSDRSTDVMNTHSV